MVPSSMWGRNVSCCVLLNRWTSSTKRTVVLLNDLFSFLALDTTSLTSATPDVHADRRTNRMLPLSYDCWECDVYFFPPKTQTLSVRKFKTSKILGAIIGQKSQFPMKIDIFLVNFIKIGNNSMIFLKSSPKFTKFKVSTALPKKWLKNQQP